MTPPLPKPDLEDHPHELWGQNVCSDFVTVEKMLAYGEACAAAEREWWREMAEQLIACHDEPTCPAVTLVREQLEKTK